MKLCDYVPEFLYPVSISEVEEFLSAPLLRLPCFLMQVRMAKYSSSGLENENYPIRTLYVVFFLTLIRQFGTSNTGECIQQTLLRNIVIVYFVFYWTCLLCFLTNIEKKGHCIGFRNQKCCHAMNHVYFLQWAGVGKFLLIQRAHVALGLSNFDKNEIMAKNILRWYRCITMLQSTGIALILGFWSSLYLLDAYLKVILNLVVCMYMCISCNHIVNQ